jgi:hypothetical protein
MQGEASAGKIDTAMALQMMRRDGDVRQDLDKRSGPTGSEVAGKTGLHVVCTVAEGCYFNGVAALANSLVRAGFEGSIVVGYRGSKPLWADSLKIRDQASHFYEISSGVHLDFVELDGTWHLANLKAHLINQIFERNADVDLVYYFDTDIFIKQAWSTLAGWARSGVVLVLDMADTYMSPHHVYRRAWQDLSAKQSLKSRDFSGYVNSGCVGVSRAFAEFPRVWSLLMEELEREGADMQKFKNWAGRLEFARMDQDVLNATIMATDAPIALLGYEAMGLFPWSGEVMPHAVHYQKPWVRNYIFDALRGFPPNRTYRDYWKFVDGPIRPFGEFELKRKKAAVKIARLIGLFHTRSFRDL